MFNPKVPEVQARIDRAFGERHLRTACLFPAMHGYQVDDERVLCAAVCLLPDQAQQRVDAGGRAGDVHPWTVDLYLDDKDLCCCGCGVVLVRAPQPGN